MNCYKFTHPKKIIILGAGQGQLPLLQTCHKYGFYVIVIAPQRANSPCFEQADKIYYADVKDKDFVLCIAKEENVISVLTDQLDVAIQTCGYVSEKLNLIGNTYFCSQLFSNKKLMHDFAYNHKIKIAENFKVHTLQEAITAIKKISYPVIIKPVDSDGSRGVSKVSSADELSEAFINAQSYSSDKTVYIEKFIQGQEYVVDGFAWNGKYQTLAIGKCYNFDLHGKCISKQRIFKSIASPLDDIEKRIIALNEKIIELFSPNIASTQGEYIYDSIRDEIYFNEIAARGGGCFVSSHLVPYACSVQVNDLLIQYIKNPDKNPTFTIKPGYSCYICFLLPSGTINIIEGEKKLGSLETLQDRFITNLKIGDEILPIKDKSSRQGPFIFASENLSKMISDIQLLKDNYKISMGYSDNDIIW